MVKSILIGNVLNLSQDNGYYLQEIKSFGYSTKYSFSDILQKHGAKIGNVLFKNKAFSVTLLVVGSSFSDLVAKRSALFQYLSVQPYATNDKIDFEFTMLNDQVVTISGVIKDVNTDFSNEMLLVSPINFVIETEYPFLVSKQEYLQNINIAAGGGAAVPMTIPLDLTQGAVVSTVLTNAGNVFAYPVFRLYGLLTNPVVTDTDNNISMSIAGTIAAGDYYEIDTYERTVIDSTGVNKLSELSDNFLFLLVGDNNFQLLTDDAGDDGYLEVVWKNHYASI